jgi:ABC-type cobalt transport system substrate-binding protein
LKTTPLVILILSIFITAGISYAADPSSVSVTATVISRGICWFTTATSALNFGNLDPSNPVDVNASTSIFFRCFRFFGQVTFFIGDDDGLYETAPDANRMQHSTITTEYLPYSFNLNPTSGTVPSSLFTNRTLTISGTVRGVDYQDARVGNYSDRVVVSIEP